MAQCLVFSYCIFTAVAILVCVCGVCAEMRDQPLDWKKAPPVHVLNYLVLGGEKDAKSKEVCVLCGRANAWLCEGACVCVCVIYVCRCMHVCDACV